MKKQFKHGKIGYILYTPEKFLPGMPLIIYLHGAGERGTNLEHLYRHGLCRLIEEGEEIPCAVLCPQCPADCVWDNVTKELKALIDTVIYELKSDLGRITITGSSMGGFGTWMMGLSYPSFFAGIAPVAGGGMSWRCEKLKGTPVFALHGGEDSTVPPIYSRLMVDAVNSVGGNATLRIICGYGHNDGIWHAYKECGVVEWLLSQKRVNFEEIPEAFSQYF